MVEEIIVFYKTILGRKRNFLGNQTRLPKKSIVPFCTKNISNQGVVGEAAACFCIESLQSAKKRGAKIYAEVQSTYDYFYSSGLSGEDPHHTGMDKVIQTTQKIYKEKIDYTIQSATGFWLLDNINYKALYKNLGEVYTTSIEPIIGHTGAASGLLNSFIACKALENNIVVPTINVDTKNIDSDFRLKYISKPLKKKIKTSSVIATGFGGYNSGVIFSKYK
ncbi:MAG: hypothetical protein GY730_04990 [bacterium]|nr:hypothetical protein [bacterium]